METVSSHRSCEIADKDGTAPLSYCVNLCSTLFHCAGAHAHPMTLTDDVSPVTIHVIVRMFLFGLEAAPAGAEQAS